MSNHPQPHEHVDEAVRTLSDLHAEHYRALPPAQVIAQRVTFAVGRPLVAAGLIVLIVLWLAARAVLLHAGIRFDPELVGLETFGTLAALLMTVLILATENRQYELTEKRAQLTLHMVLVLEQKLSKALELLERRREELGERPDLQAEAMTQPTDMKYAIDALDEAHQSILDEAFKIT
jgi:uncharacterized membrane protein